MRLTSVICSAALALSMVSMAKASTKFFCIGDQSTGYIWNDHAWRASKVALFNEKFLVQPATKDQFNYGITKVGETEPFIYCTADHSKDGKLFAVCKVITMSFEFSETSLRFEFFQGGAHVLGLDNSALPISIMLGKCSPLD